MTFRSVLFMVFIVPLAICCASSSTVNILTPATVNIPQPESISLLGMDGGAHACPVIIDGIKVVLTAKHVAFRREVLSDGEEKLFPRAWNAEVNGEIASVNPTVPHNYVDLAVVQVEPFPETYFESGELPSDEDTVYWKEYDFRTAKRAYKSRLRSADVVNVLAGYIFLDEPPTPGASGSCVMNNNFQVIGIVAFSQDMSEDGSSITGVVSIEHMR